MSNQARFVHVNTRSVFDDKNVSGEITNSDLVFIKDAQKIYTHDTEYQFVNWSKLMLDVPEGYTYFVVNGTEGALMDSEGKYFYTLK